MTVAEFQQHLKDALAASYYVATDADIASCEIFEDGPTILLSSSDESHTQFMTKYFDVDANQWCNIVTVFGNVEIRKYDPEEATSCDTMENIAEGEEESCVEKFA